MKRIAIPSLIMGLLAALPACSLSGKEPTEAPGQQDKKSPVAIKCTHGLHKGATGAIKPVNSIVVAGDTIESNGSTHPEFTGREFTSITFTTTGRVVAVVGSDGADSVALDVQQGSMDYVGDRIVDKQPDGPGRKFIVRSKGIAVGALGTQYTLTVLPNGNVDIVVTDGRVAVQMVEDAKVAGKRKFSLSRP
jgi:hypothetical protein